MGLRGEGPWFIARGFGATCAREVPGNAVFFSVYETLRWARYSGSGTQPQHDAHERLARHARI